MPFGTVGTVDIADLAEIECGGGCVVRRLRGTVVPLHGIAGAVEFLHVVTELVDGIEVCATRGHGESGFEDVTLYKGQSISEGVEYQLAVCSLVLSSYTANSIGKSAPGFTLATAHSGEFIEGGGFLGIREADIEELQ